MDPNATVILIRQAIEDGDYMAALFSADDLREWLAKGGFKPTVDGWPEVDWLLAVRKFGIEDANAIFANID